MDIVDCSTRLYATRMHTHRGDANLHSSKRFPTSRSKACNEGLPRLRPPSRLSQPEHVYVQADDALNLQRLHEQQHHHCRGSTGKVLSSLPFHKRRHHRTPSVEDDPFWMAMVACTNDTGKGSRMQFKDHRGKVFGEVNRGDSWLAKKARKDMHPTDATSKTKRQRTTTTKAKKR